MNANWILPLLGLVCCVMGFLFMRTGQRALQQTRAIHEQWHVRSEPDATLCRCCAAILYPPSPQEEEP